MVGIEGDSNHNKNFDGQSLVPLLKNPNADWNRETLYWHYPHYHTGGATPYGALRHGKWRFIEYFEDQRTELFDLSIDPGETHDLTQVNPDVSNQLRKMLHNWRAKVNAQMPSENPEYQPISP